MIGESFILGLSTGGVCLIHCLPQAFPFLNSGNLKIKEYSLKVVLFLLGRLLGYLVFGFVLGLLGFVTAGIIDTVFYRYVIIVGNIFIGVLLLSYGIIYQFPHKGICKTVKKYFGEKSGAFALGILTGINICPPFIAAATNAYIAGSVFMGIIYFLFFFLGTTLYMLPLFSMPFFYKYREKINIICRFAMIVIGIYFLLFKGVFLL
jgi:sulfite exporter TauE/SafE